MPITKEQVMENIEEVKKIIQEEEEKKIVGISIKNRFSGSIIFESKKKTWKEAIEEAFLNGADLSGAELSDANLYGISLRWANLSGADLRGTNLGGADLSEADLRGADLSGAKLRGADLMSAKFYGRGGTTKIKKNQVDDFFKALGIIVEE